MGEPGSLAGLWVVLALFGGLVAGIVIMLAWVGWIAIDGGHWPGGDAAARPGDRR